MLKMQTTFSTKFTRHKKVWLTHRKKYKFTENVPEPAQTLHLLDKDFSSEDLNEAMDTELK